MGHRVCKYLTVLKLLHPGPTYEKQSKRFANVTCISLGYDVPDIQELIYFRGRLTSSPLRS